MAATVLEEDDTVAKVRPYIAIQLAMIRCHRVIQTFADHRPIIQPTKQLPQYAGVDYGKDAAIYCYLLKSDIRAAPCLLYYV